MRAGAWGAAWREMERVDVEICPWLGEELKRELEIAKEAEAQEEALRRATEEQNSQYTRLEDEARSAHEPSVADFGSERMREIYGEDAQAYMDETQSGPPLTPSQQGSSSKPPHRPSIHELPLSTLLLNYVSVLAQDPRNVVIAALSFLVVVLAIMSSSSAEKSSISSAQRDIFSQVPSVMSYTSEIAPQSSTFASSMMDPSSTAQATAEKRQEEIGTDPDQSGPGGGSAMNIEDQFDMD